MLKRAFRDDNPIIFIEHAALYSLKGEVPDDPDYLVEFGHANIPREGPTSPSWLRRDVHQGLRAAQMLRTRRG